MIQKAEILVGTKEELLEYFNAHFSNGRPKEMRDGDKWFTEQLEIGKQLDDIKPKKMGKVFYMQCVYERPVKGKTIKALDGSDVDMSINLEFKTERVEVRPSKEEMEAFKQSALSQSISSL